MPQGLLYFTKNHEWITLDKGVATVGITTYAAEQMGDVVFVDLPQVPTSVAQGKEASVVESVKAASGIYAPVTGEITEVNHALQTTPELLNQDPQGKGWIFKMTISDEKDLAGLLDEEAYKKEQGLDFA